MDQGRIAFRPAVELSYLTEDEQTWRQFRKDYSVRDLTVRFELEKEWQAAGLRIKSRDFYKELKERIQHENDQDKAIRTHDQDL